MLLPGQDPEEVVIVDLGPRPRNIKEVGQNGKRPEVLTLAVVTGESTTRGPTY